MENTNSTEPRTLGSIPEGIQVKRSAPVEAPTPPEVPVNPPTPDTPPVQTQEPIIPQVVTPEATPPPVTPQVPTTPPVQTERVEVKVDPVMAAMQRVYKEDGNFERGIRLLNTDWDKMDDLTVLKSNMRLEHPEMDDALFNEYFENRVLPEFSPDDENDDFEVKLAKVKLAKKANSYREQIKKDKAALLATSLDQSQDVTEAPSADARPDLEWSKLVNDNEMTRSVLSDRHIVLNVGDSKVNVAVDDPQELVNTTLSPQTFFDLFSDGNGGIDFKKWYEVTAYAKNPDTFKSALVLHGKSTANGDIINELVNPANAQPPGNPGEQPQLSVPEALLALKQKSGWKRV